MAQFKINRKEGTAFGPNLPSAQVGMVIEVQTYENGVALPQPRKNISFVASFYDSACQSKWMSDKFATRHQAMRYMFSEMRRMAA